MPSEQDTTDPRVGTSFTVDGWNVTVSTERDEWMGSPDKEFPSYTPSQVAAWRADEWWWCVAIVAVSRKGIELGSASLGGIEEGFYTYTTEDDEVTGQGYVGPYTEAVDDLIEEAIENARRTLANLCRSVGA
jgi:hypothetical protein